MVLYNIGRLHSEDFTKVTMKDIAKYKADTKDLSEIRAMTYLSSATNRKPTFKLILCYVSKELQIPSPEATSVKS